MRKPKGEEVIELVVILQTEFLTCLKEARAIVSGRNIFKNLTNWDTHPRKNHLVHLETDISPATKCDTVIFEMRP